MRPVHPFPARMAPDLALERLALLPLGSRVLDPMVGSGTVLRQAISLGHSAIGFDLDPLAVLMARVWTTPVRDGAIEKSAREIVATARNLEPTMVHLPWIDDDAETAASIQYWFGPQQIADLRRIAFALHRSADETGGNDTIINVLRLALSRIIVTKEQSASLARDTSHSPPPPQGGRG